MSKLDDFGKYARSNRGISSLSLDKYSKLTSSYISPTIIEERQLNVASMDVFSRLMMDRIIFLGLPIDDYVANIVQAQLLYLDSSDREKTFRYISTHPEVRFMQVWEFMTRCSTYRPIFRLSVQGWQHRWVLFFLPPAKKASVPPSSIRG